MLSMRNVNVNVFSMLCIHSSHLFLRNISTRASVRPPTSVWMRLPTLPSPPLLRTKSPHSISPSPSLGLFSCPLVRAEPRAATAAFFLHLSRPRPLLPQFAQCLLGLFPNPALSRCLAVVAHPCRPFRWRLGARVGAPHVVPD